MTSVVRKKPKKHKNRKLEDFIVLKIISAKIRFDPKQKPTSVQQVTKFLADNGYDQYQLARGKGYFFFVGPDTSQWHTSSINVYSVGEITFDGWLSNLISFKNQHEADKNDSTDFGKLKL